MKSLTTALFENPLCIYIFLIVAELILLIIWQRCRSRRTALYLALPILLAGVVFAAERFVVTDREQIIIALEQIAEEAHIADGSEPRLEAAEQYLDEEAFVNFDKARGLGLTKSQALNVGRDVIKQFSIQHVQLLSPKVDFDNGQASTRFTTIITFDTEEMGRQRTSLIWKVHWIKRNTGWRIIKVDQPQSGIKF